MLLLLLGLAWATTEPPEPWAPGQVFAVGPSNFGRCSGRSSGPAVVLFAGPNPDPDRVAALERAADEVHRRGLRARVCMARVGIDRAAPAGGFAHVDSVEWRRALGEALGEVEAGRLRALVRKAVPRVVLLRSGSFDELTSGAEAHDLIDNLGRYAAPPPAPSLLPSLTASNFTRATHASPLMLVAFTVRWCARCADLALQLQSAAALFPSLQPAVAASIAVVDMDDPRNSPLARELGVVSFPVGQLYSYGKLLGTYLGGPTAPEIAQEMVARARELAEETPRRAHSAKDEV